MSRGIRPRSSVAHLAGSVIALVAAAMLATPSQASAVIMEDRLPVMPVVGPVVTQPASTPAERRSRAVAAHHPVDLAGKRRAIAAKPKPPAPHFGPWKVAVCSWYDEPQPLAGGGYLKPGMMIVAHKTLPFGTRIQFTYHGKSCIAVVKDRGPYVRGREFDLGPGTAAALGFTGVGRVSYRLVLR